MKYLRSLGVEHGLIKEIVRTSYSLEHLDVILYDNSKHYNVSMGDIIWE